MKIRIKGNSIRLRLSKSEAALFALKGYLEERTDFGDSAFIYAVGSTEDENMSASFTMGNIIVHIPQHLLNQWATTNLVSLDYTMPLGDNKSLYILLEKDFKCIDAVVTEDQSDYFENPAKSC
ncbi:MAG: hypothetical protein ABIN25_09535 [Ginsengibacter sp.]